MTKFNAVAQRRGYRSQIDAADVEYFNTICLASPRPPIQGVPDGQSGSGDDRSHPCGNGDPTARPRADRLLASLRSTRSAIISFKLKHIDVENELIEQDARVRTKRAKTFTSWFFPVGDDFRTFSSIGSASCASKRLGPEDPLFPKSKLTPDDNLEFRAVNLDRAHRANANRVRAIFREACALAGLPYFNPHSLRNTLVQIAYELKLDPESWKAWSQNLGHENCLTTFTGKFSPLGKLKLYAASLSPTARPKGEWLPAAAANCRPAGEDWEAVMTHPRGDHESAGRQWPQCANSGHSPRRGEQVKSGA